MRHSSSLGLGEFGIISLKFRTISIGIKLKTSSFICKTATIMHGRQYHLLLYILLWRYHYSHFLLKPFIISNIVDLTVNGRPPK